MLAERHVAEALPGQSPEVMGLPRQRLATIQDGALVVLGEIARGRALVPSLDEFRRPGHNPGEDALRFSEVAPLHRLDALGQTRVDLGVPRPTPHLPEGGLGARRLGWIVPLQQRHGFALRHWRPPGAPGDTVSLPPPLASAPGCGVESRRRPGLDTSP